MVSAIYNLYVPNNFKKFLSNSFMSNFNSYVTYKANDAKKKYKSVVSFKKTTIKVKI